MNQGKRRGGAVASWRRGAAGLWSQRFTRRPAPEAEAASASRPRQPSARTSTTHLASTNSCSGGRRSPSPSGSHGAASLRRTPGPRQPSRLPVAVVPFDGPTAPARRLARRRDARKRTLLLQHQLVADAELAIVAWPHLGALLAHADRVEVLRPGLEHLAAHDPPPT